LALSQDDFLAFEALVNDNQSFNEIKCGSYLHHAAPLLLPGTPLEFTADREDRNYFGSTDFVIAAKLRDDQMGETISAFIWELKAPQCYLFEPDNNKNRFRPTIDYVKAENQLLHYYHQAVGDSVFRQRFGIMDTKNIKLGGVIIGRSSDRLAKDINTSIDRSNAQMALDVRRNYLYQAFGIRVLLWDRILAFLKPPTK
jgi:hypothetical protein